MKEDKIVALISREIDTCTSLTSDQKAFIIYATLCRAGVIQLSVGEKAMEPKKTREFYIVEGKKTLEAFYGLSDCAQMFEKGDTEKLEVIHVKECIEPEVKEEVSPLDELEEWLYAHMREGMVRKLEEDVHIPLKRVLTKIAELRKSEKPR